MKTIALQDVFERSGTLCFEFLKYFLVKKRKLPFIKRRGANKMLTIPHS